MMDQDVANLKYRIQLGRIKEFEDEKGDLKYNFTHTKEVWAEVKPVQLTAKIGSLNVDEKHPKHIKNIFFIKIRENVIVGGRHGEINAIIWKYKILTNN